MTNILEANVSEDLSVVCNGVELVVSLGYIGLEGLTQLLAEKLYALQQLGSRAKAQFKETVAQDSYVRQII